MRLFPQFVWACMSACLCVRKWDLYFVCKTPGLLSLCQSLHLSGSSLTHIVCDVFSVFSLTSVFLTLHVCMPIFLCRCFDRQGYCSRGWCLDTTWHYATPWAHAQIREDIRNPSLHVSFNHTGWRRNVFMDLIVKQICLHVCPLSVLLLSLRLSSLWSIHDM